MQNTQYPVMLERTNVPCILTVQLISLRVAKLIQPYHPRIVSSLGGNLETPSLQGEGSRGHPFLGAQRQVILVQSIDHFYTPVSATPTFPRSSYKLQSHILIRNRTEFFTEPRIQIDETQIGNARS